MGYFLINKQTSIVDNAVAWDGDVSKWQPPETHIAIPVASTICIGWDLDQNTFEWVPVESVGGGGIGDTWDGTKLTKIKPSPYNPNTIGTQEV